MPRYFLDSADGDLKVIDDEGIELQDPREARKFAIDVLPDMARDKIPDGDHREFSVRVRDHDGRVIYTASLTLSGEWQVTPPS